MNIQDKISALEAEKTAADARIAMANAQIAAANQRASEKKRPCLQSRGRDSKVAFESKLSRRQETANSIEIASFWK